MKPMNRGILGSEHRDRPASASALPPRGFLACARRIGVPENFFVGLPDAILPPPRNLLLFFQHRVPDPEIRAAHHRHLLILNLVSDVRMLIDSHMLCLSAGQALLLFPFQVHRYLKREPDECGTQRLCVSFEAEETGALEELRNRCVNLTPAIWPLINALVTEYRTASPTEPADAVGAWLTLLLLRLREQVRQQPIIPWEPHPGLPAHRIVQCACRAIDTRLNTMFSIRQLAADLHVSAGHLRTCFDRVLGLSVNAYIRRTRVRTACALLSRTESNMTEIADRCGFLSVFTFSRAFKREIGMPPTRYRKHLWEGRNIPGRPPPSRRRSGASPV